MIIREKPYLILKIRNNVYKFLPNNLLAIETCWLVIKKNLKEFNKITNEMKLKIPTVEKSPYYIKTIYFGKDLFTLGSNIEDLYKTIRDFSYMFLENDKTISLGDIQLRNVYLNQDEFILSDLGIHAEQKVDIYYDRARFLVNLIDCNYQNKVNNILNNEKDKKNILASMEKRYLKVMKKRIKNLKIISSLFRSIKFILWRYS